MSKSQTAGWASDSPPPAQLKEFFAQIDSGRITKDRLQSFLRGADPVEGDWFSFTTTEASLNKLRRENPDLFYQRDPWWKNEEFAKRRGQVRRLTLRISEQPGSFGKNWREKQDLLSGNEYVPTARDVVEGMIAYYRQTGKRLFPDFYLRTSDVSSNGDRIYVGFFGSGGLAVDSHWDGGRGSNLGLAVARNP